MKKLTIILSFTLLLLGSLNLKNTDGKTSFKGFIYEGENKSINTTYNVYCDNQLKSSNVSKSNGSFKLNLQRNKIYLVEMLKEGYVTKWILINTKNLPNKFIRPFEFDIEMVEKGQENPEIDYDRPIGVVFYNRKKRDYTTTQVHKKNFDKALEKCNYDAERLKF